MSCAIKGHARCSPTCPPPLRADGTRSRSMLSFCLLCFNTGCRIPINGKHTIPQWEAMHRGESK